MFTPEEEDRLESALPLEHTVEYDGNSATYILDPFWSGGDESGDDASEGPDLPSIVFEWDQQGQEDDERQPVGDVAEVDENEGESTMIEHHVSRVIDDLSVTISTSKQWKDGIAPTVRARKIARAVWRFCRFQLDLSEPGENGERPMIHEVLESPSGADADRKIVIEFQLRFRSVLVEDVERDGVSDISYGVDTE